MTDFESLTELQQIILFELLDCREKSISVSATKFAKLLSENFAWSSIWFALRALKQKSLIEMEKNQALALEPMVEVALKTLKKSWGND